MHGVGVVLDSTAWAELSKGIRVGVVLDMTAWAELDKGIEVGVVLDMAGWAELGKGRRSGEDCVDESKRVAESSKLCSSEHIVQLDNIRWYLLFS